MSGEAIARVPLTDWLMAVAVLACGVVAIAATWRCTRLLTLATTAEDTGDGGLDEAREPQLALPPGPPNVVVPLDDIDRALWDLIEDEYARVPAGRRHRRDDVLLPAARRAAA
jgi:hypothetical protein